MSAATTLQHRTRHVPHKGLWGRTSLALVAGMLPVLIAGLLCPAGSGPAASPPPNVVVLLIDALREDHLGCYGHRLETTPTLDALSREAVLFEEARSSACWTKPSIPSLFTGLYPIQHLVFTGSTQDRSDRITSDVLSGDHVTLAEALRSRGYATAAFVENAQISSFLGFDQGFDTYAENLGRAGNITDRFLHWLGSHDSDKPFFAYVHYLDPHWPYDPPAPYDELFPRPKSASVDFNRVNWKTFERDIASGKVELTPEDLESMQALYDGEIRYADDSIARLLEALRERGLYENTVVVVTADHGEAFLEHGKLGHGHSLYEELLRIPLLVRAPGVKPRRVGGLVELIDVMPTILDLAGADIPEGVAGRSLRPLLEGGSLEPRPSFADHRPGNGSLRQSIRDGRYKLIRTFSVEGEASSASPWIPPRIAEGDWLEIEVARNGEDFEALEIEADEDLGQMRISGQVEGLSAEGSAFRIIGIPCRLASKVKWKTSSGQRIKDGKLEEGAWIQVKGGWKDADFEVVRVKTLEDRSDWDQEIKGPVEGVSYGEDGMSIRLPGFEIEANEDTDFEGEWDDWMNDPSGIPDEEDPAESGTPKRVLVDVRLFDLTTDPGELTSIADEKPDLARRLYARLEEWESTLGKTTRAQARAVLDAATLERLRSLGYVH